MRADLLRCRFAYVVRHNGIRAAIPSTGRNPGSSNEFMNSIPSMAPPGSPPTVLTLTPTLRSRRVVHSGQCHGIWAAILSTSLPSVLLGSRKKLSVSISTQQTWNLKVPPPRPSKSREVPAVSPGLTIRAWPMGVLGVVLSALHAGALGHTIFSDLGNLLFLAHHRAVHGRQTLRDSVWSMLQDRSLRNLSLTRGLRLANPSELALPPWATRDCTV